VLVGSGVSHIKRKMQTKWIQKRSESNPEKNINFHGWIGKLYVGLFVDTEDLIFNIIDMEVSWK